MLLEQTVLLKTNNSNYKYYREKGYKFENIGDEILVDVYDLSKGSKSKVWVECDYCGKIFKKIYHDYLYKVKNHVNPKVSCKNQKCIEKKKIETCKKNFGTKYPSQSEEVKQKMIESRIESLGVPWAMQNKNVKKKTKKSLYKNGTAPYSKQQLYLCNLLNGKLNYPIDNCSVDILLDHNIVIEYNGGGHDKNVHAGVIARKEFEEKERKRDYFIKSQGYKIIKIISPRDYLPPDDKLIELISNAIKFMKENNTNHYNIEFGDKINDKKYGKLRKITKKMIKEQELKKSSFFNENKEVI